MQSLQRAPPERVIPPAQPLLHSRGVTGSVSKMRACFHRCPDDKLLCVQGDDTARVAITQGQIDAIQVLVNSLSLPPLTSPAPLSLNKSHPIVVIVSHPPSGRQNCIFLRPNRSMHAICRQSQALVSSTSLAEASNEALLAPYRPCPHPML